MFATKFVAVVGVLSALSSAVLSFVPPGEGVTGGWSESGGTVVAQQGTAESPQLTNFAVNHRGKAESKTINGTSHKRSHGWTTWANVRHYTTAQLEHYWPYSGVIATSGRKWGTGGTEAVTKWVAFNPNAASSGYGQARTYYGR